MDMDSYLELTAQSLTPFHFPHVYHKTIPRIHVRNGERHHECYLCFDDIANHFSWRVDNLIYFPKRV